jgi:hypothetical protein
MSNFNDSSNLILAGFSEEIIKHFTINAAQKERLKTVMQEIVKGIQPPALPKAVQTQLQNIIAEMKANRNVLSYSPKVHVGEWMRNDYDISEDQKL